MKKLNTERMLKNIARNFADRQIFKCDPITLGEFEFGRLRLQFEAHAKRMWKAKYGEGGVIKIWYDETASLYPGDAVFIYHFTPQSQIRVPVPGR